MDSPDNKPEENKKTQSEDKPLSIFEKIDIIQEARRVRKGLPPKDSFANFQNQVVETSHRYGDKGIIER